MGGPFDVVIIGAGINGAAVCHALAAAGYRVLLVDQGDFGSGTSQASTMLIWGGLLYLKNLELATVLALTRDRDRLVAERPDSVQARPLLYVPSTGPPRVVVESALAAYWVMGAGKRARPQRLDHYDEQAHLADAGSAYAIEEAALVTSDARFVLEFALAAERLGAEVRNHVRVTAIDAGGSGSGWRLHLCDALTGVTSEVQARMVVNAAGCWTDGINEKAGLASPWRHLFSRGVSLAFPRPAWHTRHLVLDSVEGDVMTLAPWGPVSLWGSTDAFHDDLAEARRPADVDVARLLEELNRHLRAPVGESDIISLRTGVRPVPVRHDARVPRTPGSLTRHHRLHLDETRPWVSIYGGKLSGCLGLAADVCRLVAQRVSPRGTPPRPGTGDGGGPRVTTTFPTLDEPVVSAAWSAAHEHCASLDDYLRRRTNIAQWVRRGGFGAHGEHADTLERIALEIHDGDSGLAERDLRMYWQQVCEADEPLAPATPAEAAYPARVEMDMTDTRPALLGGSPAVTLDQQAANRWPVLEADDEAAVLEVMRHGDLSNHVVTRHLEDDFRARLGCRHALAHANGTLGLLAAFHALNLVPGDEILVPSATFWASVVPMLWVGAVPVFCEIEGERFALDPADVERRITPRTRAMVIVHLWGLPAKVDALLDIARRHGLAVIEDASHALGAVSGGVPCGRFGDISVFSLQTSKLAAAGEGGVFLTDNDTYMERAICLGDIVRIYELTTPARRFAATSFGIKTRMAPLSAAVGRTQLAKLDRHNARRAANIEALGARLAPLGFETFPSPPGTSRVYFEHLVRYDPAHFDGLPVEALIAALAAEGCDVTGPRYPLVHQQPFFTEGHWRQVARLAPGDHAAWQPPDLPMSAAVQRNMLRLPTFPWAEPALIEQYAQAFEKVHAHASRLPRPAHA